MSLSFFIDWLIELYNLNCLSFWLCLFTDFYNVFKIRPVIEPKKLSVHSSWFTGQTDDRTTVKPVTS